MIFTRLTIENFGVYRDLNSFYLRPGVEDDAVRPVVLFGGKNGSGKTTILDAIRLCLYGRAALGNRVRQRDYEQYIAQRLHRDAVQRSETGSIQLAFEHAHTGTRSVYEAIRSWEIIGKQFKESVELYKDGQVLQDIPQEHWDDFLRDLIPPGVADLFFFDGEQIQALASETTEAEALSDAIRGLLNLELVERLNTDLNTYLRQQKHHDHSKLETEARQALAQQDEIEAEITTLKRQKAHLRSQLDLVNNRIDQARQALLSEGAGFIEARDELHSRRAEVEREIEQVNTMIRDAAAELLPFAIAPQWSQRLRARLQHEEATRKHIIANEVLEDAAAQLTAQLLSEEYFEQRVSRLSHSEWAAIVGDIEAILLPSHGVQESGVRHPISTQTRELLQGWIEESIDAVPLQMAELGSRLEILEHERAEIEQKLEHMPDDMIAQPLIEDFQRWSAEQGSLEEQIDAVEADLKRLKSQLADAERLYRRAKTALADAEGLDARVRRAAKAQVILDEYLERITKVKIEELESTFVEYFNLLARKKGMVQAVSIDSQSFATTLYGSNRMPIPKTDLSAGEKQLYAMALLWALRAVSGRVLPIIMDTPMGRLDTDHRTALLENFFPNVAHQVILLSTDSEIDAEAYAQLEESVSHTYRLEYDEDAGYTRVIESYFGQTEPEVS